MPRGGRPHRPHCDPPADHPSKGKAEDRLPPAEAPTHPDAAAPVRTSAPPPEGALGYCTCARVAGSTKRRKKLGSPPPLCDIPSGCCSFTGPWTVTRSSLRMLRRVAAFCRPLRPVLLLVSFPRSRSPVFGVLGLC